MTDSHPTSMPIWAGQWASTHSRSTRITVVMHDWLLAEVRRRYPSCEIAVVEQPAGRGQAWFLDVQGDAPSVLENAIEYALGLQRGILYPVGAH